MNNKFVLSYSDNSITAATMKVILRAKLNMLQVQDHIKYCSKNFRMIKVLTVERVNHNLDEKKKKKINRHRSCERLWFCFRIN